MDKEMHMKQSLWLLTICVLMAGCRHEPTVAAYQGELNGWIGKSEEDLYASWGYPNTSYSVADDTFIATYIENFNTPVQGDADPYADEMVYSAMKTPTFGLPTPQGVYYCKTSFVIQNGVVVDYNLNGDDCVR